MVKVSFLIAAYNIEDYIEKCLKSIINQSLKEIEIIVVDDGSKDSTLEVVKKQSKLDSRIKYISQENKGIVEARKTGLKNAIGEYVVFIDGDDWTDKNLAEKLYSLAKKTESDIVCYEYCLVYDNGKVAYQKDKIYEDIFGDRYLELILRQEIKHNLVIKFIKRNFIEESSFYDICNVSMGEDLVTNVALGIKKPSVVMTNEVYYYYYQRDTSTTNKSSEKLLEIIKTLEYIEELLKKNNIYEKYKEGMDALWFRHCYMYHVVNSMISIDKYHKKMYETWKSKKINIKDNIYCKKYLSMLKINRRIMKKLFDFNYSIGALALKIEHIIRGV